MQERVHRGELSIIKVRGEDNVADGVTKHVERSNVEMYMETCGFARRDTSSALTLEMFKFFAKPNWFNLCFPFSPFATMACA